MRRRRHRPRGYFNLLARIMEDRAEDGAWRASIALFGSIPIRNRLAARRAAASTVEPVFCPNDSTRSRGARRVRPRHSFKPEIEAAFVFLTNFSDPAAGMARHGKARHITAPLPGLLRGSTVECSEMVLELRLRV